MEILVFNRQTDLNISVESVKKVVEHVLHQEGRSTDEVSILFVSTNEICRLHEEFFNDPSTTDCISFPIDQSSEDQHYHILGEIFVCPQTAIDYILKTSELVNEDRYRETTLYVVHGLLHLLGYDDIDPKDRKKMREAENKHMHNLISKKALLMA